MISLNRKTKRGEITLGYYCTVFNSLCVDLCVKQQREYRRTKRCRNDFLNIYIVAIKENIKDARML